MMEEKIFDIAIIGFGPAGITSGIYASRYKLASIIIGKVKGGMITTSHLMDNYPGIEDISGVDFANKIVKHLKKYDECKIKEDEVIGISEIDNLFFMSTKNGENIKSKSIIIATGTEKRQANIKGEKDFIGKGVSYCTTCDGFLYKNKKVVVLGSGDSAFNSALYLSSIAEKVYLVCRKCSPSTEDKKVINKVEENPKIEILYETEIEEIKGEKMVEKIITNKNEEIEVSGVFIEIGLIPQSILFKNLNLEFENNFIKVNKYCETSKVGVFAAGDITTGFSELKQVITAEAMGAVAATSANKYLKTK
jgi:thioredoxin reductase (NADPH)